MSGICKRIEKINSEPDQIVIRKLKANKPDLFQQKLGSKIYYLP